jgi:ABC-type Fe3+ transport system permease subunit
MTIPAQAYPEQSQSTSILVFGILSLICCPFLGIAAWVMGNNELQAIDEGRRDPKNRSNATVGRILGWIGLGLWLLGAILTASGTVANPFANLGR